jgi:sortase A
MIADESRPRLALTRHLERLMVAIGVMCLAWVGWAWLDARHFQAEVVAAAVRAPTHQGRAHLAAARPSEGSVVCQLRIPRIGIGLAVAEGVSERVLRRAVGHLPASALPGRPGNIVLAGHRDTFFRELEHVRMGDAIYLDSGVGADLYLVEWIRVVPPSYVSIMERTADRTLTLVTCYPFRYIGSAPSRFVVRARHASGAADSGLRGFAPASARGHGQ